MGDGADHEWAGDAAVREVLTGLGLATTGLDADWRGCQGGERRRVAPRPPARRRQHRRPDLLVLDEPTNHLDVEGVAWLAELLVARRGALVVVTHDRWFLDAVCYTTWEVVDGGGPAATTAVTRRTCSPGPNASATRRRPRRAGRTCCARSWPGCGAVRRRARPSRGSASTRPNALIADEPPARESLQLRRTAAVRLGKRVYDVEDVTMTRGRPRAAQPRHVATSARASASASSASTASGKTQPAAPARGRAARRQPATVKAGTTVPAGYLSQEVAEHRPGRAARARSRGGGADASCRLEGGGGAHRRAAAGVLRLPGRQAVDAGR